MRWRIAGVILVTLGAGACGGKGASTATSPLYRCSQSAPDAAAWMTVPVQDGGAVTANVELSCPGSISEYCADALACPPLDFADVIASQNATGLPPDFYICEPYNWVDTGFGCGGSTEILFAYDKGTGKLVGAVELASPEIAKQTCLGGPATLAPLGACTAYYDCFPNDAGYPRRHCYGDGGVGASGDGG